MKKPVVFGFIGGLALLLLYFLILALANSPAHARQQFLEMWYWILLLAAGFGIQAGLYTHIRIAHRSQKSNTTAVAASGGMSTVSMAACCAHHLTDVLPLLGLSAAAIFLVKYQTFFILVGVVSNFIGITVMLRVIQDSGLAGDSRVLRSVVGYDLKEVQKLVIFSGAVLLAAVYLVSG